MTSEQVAEWMAFYRLEPWGAYEDDRRMATIAATIANTTPGKKQKRWKVDDFMPRRERKQPQSMEQMKAVTAMMARESGYRSS